MKASELKIGEEFTLEGRKWKLLVISTAYAQNVTVKPDGTGAALKEQVIIAEDEHEMIVIVPFRANVEKTSHAEIIKFPITPIEEKKAANE